MNIQHFYKDKVVLITGASMGIGKELARQVLAFGGKVVLTARNAERLQNVQKEFEQYADCMLIHAGDVASYEDNVLLMDEIHERFGKLDVLINNAGMSCYGELEKLKPQILREVIDTNIYGSIYPVISALKQFKGTLDAIIFVSSIAGFYGLPAYTAYSLSKRALQPLAQSLRIELEHDGIFVGIAYISFTENEDQKRTLSPTGELVSIPARPKRLLSTREDTARKMLKQIKSRKRSEIHSLFGKFVFFMSNYFSSIMGFILRRKYQKEKINEV